MFNYIIFAFIGTALTGINLALFSPFVTLKKISYMGEAISHIAFAGIAFGFLWGFNLTISSLIFVIIVGGLIGTLSRILKSHESNLTTIFLSVSMALAIVVISWRNEYTFDLASYLFGNVLLITKTDIYSLIALCAVNIFTIVYLYKELFYTTYNMEVSKVFKIKVNFVYYVLIVLLMVNIVINLKIAGIILVTAQLILPSSCAFNLTKRLHSAIVISVIIAVVSAVIGFYLSWIMNIPTGGAIVLLEFMVFLITAFIKWIKV